jgi:ABC-2 type transport system permease protein
VHNLWLVARNEYRRTVLRRAFLIATLAIPVAIVALVGLVFLMMRSTEDRRPVGYVDQAGIMNASLQATLPDAGKRIEIRAFAGEEEALAALNAGQIQGFFVLPAGYPAALNTKLYVMKGTLDSRAWGQFDDLVRASLLAAYPDDVRARLWEGASVTVHDTSSGRQFSQGAVVNIILPFVASAFFFIATMMASGYMLEAVAKEKENRTMEILLTSVTPGQLIGGKALGLLAATLTQLAVYAVAAVAALVILAPLVPELQQIAVPWGYLGMMGLLFLPAYVLFAAIMLAIGSAVTEVQQGQQMSGILNLVFMAPLFALTLLFSNPSHPLLVFLSLFPPTSFLMLSLRWGLGSIPVWQIGLGWGLLVASAVGMVWVAVRVFRAGVLIYGQPLRLKAVWAALRG